MHPHQTDGPNVRIPGPADGGPAPAAPGRLAVVAMALGAVSLVTSFLVIGGPLGLVGLALGAPARARARRTGGAGEREAVVGMVLSGTAVVVAVLVGIFAVWFAHRTQSCYHLRRVHPWLDCVRGRLGDGG